MNAEILDTARHRVATVGWTNVSFHHGEFDDLEPGDDFDAVIGRWILMYLPQPADLLRRGVGLAAPRRACWRSKKATFAAPFAHTPRHRSTSRPGAGRHLHPARQDRRSRWG